MDDEEMNKLLEEQSRLQEPLSTPSAAGSSSGTRSRPTRCACRRGTRSSTSSRAARSAAWPCAACCSPRPTCCRRRADQPSRRRTDRRLEKYLEGVSVHRHRSHARSLLPRQRGRMDSRARSRSWHSLRATTRPGWNRKERGSPRKRSINATTRDGARVGAHESQGSPRRDKARVARYEVLASREFQERNETNEIYIPPGDRLG